MAPQPARSGGGAARDTDLDADWARCGSLVDDSTEPRSRWLHAACGRLHHGSIGVGPGGGSSVPVVEFRILGPLEVHDESGAVGLGGVKARAVLAVLLLHPNEPVHAERLALALWGEEAPASAVKTVQVYVSRLRKALGDADVLATTPAGYRLRVRAGELDAERFSRLVEDGRHALAAGRAQHAATVLREALALWRGSPLADLAFEPFAQAEIARLEEQRLAALEERVDADLAAGRHAALVAELRQLVGASPTRERLAAQLMIALYRSGQQAAALEAFQATRSVLVAEIGVEPGPELRRLEQAILCQDAALELRAAPAELPPELDAGSAPPLAGREDELAWLRKRWNLARNGRGAVVTMTGVRGIGKSRMAAELAGEAHRLGATVLYVAGADASDDSLPTMDRARGATHPTLLIVDDADRASAGVLAELAEMTRALAGVPVLVLATGMDGDRLARLGCEDSLVLEALDAGAVLTITTRYASGRAAEEVPAELLLQASAGVPRRVHEVAGQWARREAVRRVGAVAGRAAAGRTQLRSMELELAGDVVDLQTARERVESDDTSQAAVVCPFKGLASFEVADAEYFFGRERLVAELVARLVGAPLLGVVGPSGSGKSSVLRAGLLPALANGMLPGSERWTQVVMRPGEDPLSELAVAAARLGADGRFVLAVDQFEETFTACRNEHDRTAFIAELARTAHMGEDRGIVVLVVRADYYGRCAAYPGLSRLLAANHVLVGPMRRDELRRAVECPSRRAGLRVEPELTDALVADVEDEPGALPLLSAALLELWQHRDGRRLRHAAYERIGGVRGAVARLAEEVFTQLDPVRQAVARTVVMRLVGLGAEGAVERRRVPVTEFGTDESNDVAHVLALFTDRRLLTVSTGTVEIAHEALLREWPRLGGWIEENRDGLRIHRGLSGASQEWQRLSRDDGALYRGTRLTETLAWRAARAPSLNDLEREFLLACEASLAREGATRRRRIRLIGTGLAALTAAVAAVVVTVLFAARDRDVAASRDLATRSATVIATNPGLAVAIALEALRRSDTEQAQNALRQATLAHRATMVVAAHRGLVFGVAPSPDGDFAATAGGDRTVRVWSLGSGRRVAEIRGYREEVRAVSFSPDGRQIASAARDGEVAVAAADGGPRHVVARLEHDFASSIDFGTDDATIAIGTERGRVAIVRPHDRTLRDLTPAHAGPVFCVRFDAGGRRVVTAGGDGFARIWNVSGGQPLALAHGRGRLVLAAGFSPDGQRVATVDFAGVLRLWDASTGRLAKRVRVGDNPLASVSFSADGRRLVIGGADGVIDVVAARGGIVLAQMRGHQGPARADFVPDSGAIVSAGEEDGTLRTWRAPASSVSQRPGTYPYFSRDGRLVVAGDVSGAIHLWNPSTGEERELIGHRASSFPQFSPAGDRIVSASDDGTVRLWDVKSGRQHLVPALGGQKLAAAIDPAGERIAIGGTTPLVIQRPDGGGRIRLRAPRARVNMLTFSPDGMHLLTGGDDGSPRIWDTRSGALERTLHGHEGVVSDVSYSDDGRLIATAGSDGTVRIWPAEGGAPVILVGHEGAVNTANFDRGGDRIVSAGVDGTVRIWDTAGGEALAVLQRYDGDASGADLGNGRAVVSAGDGVMRVAACEVCQGPEDVLRVAGTRAQHDLTAAERRRLLPSG